MVDYVITSGNNYTEVGLDPEPDPISELPQIFANQEFSYNITLTESGLPTANYTGLTITDQPSFITTYVTSNNTFTVVKDNSEIIFDEYYRVVYTDPEYNQTFQNLTKSQWDALSNKTDYKVIEYIVPTSQEVTDNISFTLNFINDDGDPDSNSITYSQDYVWSSALGTPTFLNILNEATPPTNNDIIIEFTEGVETPNVSNLSNTSLSSSDIEELVGDLLANTDFLDNL